MPLTQIPDRASVHRRVIDMQTYDRGNGLYDAEAHLVDRKPFDFTRVGAVDVVPAGEPFHDLWVRLTVDAQFTVVAVEAASDVTPWAVCKEAQRTLEALIGQVIERGWTATVKQRLRGAASCTHLAEMLIPLATTALMGIYGLRPEATRQAGVGLLVDSCYAFDKGRDVVRRLVPLQYQPRVET